MAHIAILGAGTGGMPAAYELRAALGSQHRITVVNAVDYFQFVPSNPWLAVGWRKRSAITFPIAPHLMRRNIDFIAQSVSKIDAVQNRLEMADGGNLSYDYLLITTGPKLSFAEVPGSGPDGGFTQSVCTVDHAEKTWAAYQEFLKNPGPVIIGAMPMASCFGPAYEFSFILNTDLRRRRLRHKIPITYVTSEPYIGHLGLGGVGDSKGLLESEFRNNDVKWITNAKITRLEAGKMFVTEVDANGQTVKEHELPFKFSMMLPAFKGVDAVAAVEGLCNPRGYMIETMVTAIVKNIVADVAGQPATAKRSWNAICLADMGSTGAAFVALPQIPPRNVNWFKKGRWVHWAKVAFEKYFIFKMKRGHYEPLYEKYILKLLGIHRLQV